MTESVINLRYLAESQPSLCIPRVFNNIDEARIRLVFDQLRLGIIHHIDIVTRKNDKGEPFKRVYIHFEKWLWNESAKAARTKLISGKEIKIVYDNPWFWKISANKWVPKEYEPRRNYTDLETKTSRQIAPALSNVDEFRRNVQIKKQYEEQRPRYDIKYEKSLSAKAKVFTPRSPDCSPPRQRELRNEH